MMSLLSVLEVAEHFLDNDPWMLQRKAEAEVRRLQAKGWKQNDFAQALVRVLEGKDE